MSTVGIVIATFAGTAIFVAAALSLAYDAFVRYPAGVRKRLRDLSGTTKRPAHFALVDVKQLAKTASIAPNRWLLWSGDIIEQAGMRFELRTVITASIICAAAAALISGLLTARWWTAAIGLFAGLATPWLYVLAKRRARIRRLMRQLPDALDVMCRAVRAGQTVPASLQMVADDFAPPICDEFRYCYEQQNLGISYDAALRNLARRTGIMELRILVVALLVQSRSGGSLTELIQNLATMVRKRLVLQQKVKSLTGEGRMQAAVLIALPFVVFATMYFVNREYAQILLDRPWLLMACACSQAIGAALIHKLIQIDY